MTTTIPTASSIGTGVPRVPLFHKSNTQERLSPKNDVPRGVPRRPPFPQTITTKQLSSVPLRNSAKYALLTKITLTATATILAPHHGEKMKRTTKNKKILAVAESLFGGGEPVGMAEQVKPDASNETLPPPQAPSVSLDRESTRTRHTKPHRGTQVVQATQPATPPSTIAAPCICCQSPIFWTDPADEPHCGECDPCPFPQAQRGRWIVIDTSEPGEPDGTRTDWEEIERVKVADPFPVKPRPNYLDHQEAEPQPETRRSPNGKIRASTEYAE